MFLSQFITIFEIDIIRLMILILKLFLAGWVILVAAILLNFLAIKFGISTWYPFTDSISKNGFLKVFKELSLVSKLFLFIIYPFLLGLSGFLVLKFIK